MFREVTENTKTRLAGRVEDALHYIKSRRLRERAEYDALPWWRKLFAASPYGIDATEYGWRHIPTLMDLRRSLREDYAESGVLHVSERALAELRAVEDDHEEEFQL